jgi:c-di-GMP-binding flagellar brake protein YcgR
MKDARRHSRHVVDRFLPVYERSNERLVGYLTDVNVGGGMIESRDPVSEESNLTLRIELGEPIDGAESIRVDARCVWARKPRNNFFHCIGLEFSELDAEQQRQLETLAERYRLAAAE